MKKLLILNFLALLMAHGKSHALTFDQAFMVATPLSTSQVTAFSIDGPTPWLFVDLPALGSFFTTVNSSWFRDGIAAPQFQVIPSQQQNDRFWLSPTDLTWVAARALGAWHIDASFALTGILFVENGGIGVGVNEGTGSTIVEFTVTPSPVPLPASGFLMVMAAGALLRWRPRTTLSDARP